MTSKRPGVYAEDAGNEVVIGANAEASKDAELMEAIPKDKQLTVTFNSISGWVPLMHKADSSVQQLKNLFTSKQEVHEAAKVQRKQVRLGGPALPSLWQKAVYNLLLHCRLCTTWQVLATLERCWPSWVPLALAKRPSFL